MRNQENKKEKQDEEADVVLDEEFSSGQVDDGAAEVPEEKIRRLKHSLANCEKERQEYLRGWQRAKADFINARREDEEARKNIFSLAKEDLLFEMLPIADSFALAFKDREAWERLPEGWRKGIEHINSHLLKIFEEQGLKELSPLGEMFDPAFHESVESVATTDETEHNKILSVLQNGYVLNGKVLRPARVKVGEYKR